MNKTYFLNGLAHRHGWKGVNYCSIIIFISTSPKFSFKSGICCQQYRNFFLNSASYRNVLQCDWFTSVWTGRKPDTNEKQTLMKCGSSSVGKKAVKLTRYIWHHHEKQRTCCTLCHGPPEGFWRGSSFTACWMASRLLAGLWFCDGWLEGCWKQQKLRDIL